MLYILCPIADNTQRKEAATNAADDEHELSPRVRMGRPYGQ